jgi:hypothetical protein
MESDPGQLRVMDNREAISSRSRKPWLTEAPGVVDGKPYRDNNGMSSVLSVNVCRS